MNLLIAEAASKTGALLRTYLEERGLEVDGTSPIVCYGAPAGKVKVPVLNAACSTNKMERLRLMTEAGVSTIKWFEGDKIPKDIKFPLYARQSHGHGAKDLMPVFQVEEIPWRLAAGWDWFSEIVPIASELRVWAWRASKDAPTEVFGAYQKVMDRPGDYKKMGRNFGQGFEFKPFKIQPEDRCIVQEACKAIESVGLNFAAVDMIVSKNAKVYVLEANTAPGVIRSGAQATLKALADRIKTWHDSVA